MHKNELLYKAVQSLYGSGVITKDKDIADKLGYTKATVSSYLSGKTKASNHFERLFEKSFDVKLSDFEPGGKHEAVIVPDSLQLITESILQMKAEIQTNRQLMVEVLAQVSDRSVSEVNLMAESLLKHNLAKIASELKQEKLS
jgi:predicted transcriptional regulator